MTGGAQKESREAILQGPSFFVWIDFAFPESYKSISKRPGGIEDRNS